MSHTLTESASFDSTVTVPDDGDAGVASSVVGAFQSLADRSQYNKVNGPDVIANGVPRFRAGITTDMQNTPASNGDWYFDINRGLFYAWDGTGPDGVITFDNLVTSGKLWWRYDWNSDLEGYSPLIGPNGNSPTNPVGRINPAIQNNYILDIGQSATGSPGYSNDTTDTTEISNFTWLDLINGDIIQGEMLLLAYMAGGTAEWGAIHVSFNDGATTNLDAFDLTITSHTIYNPYIIPFHHVVVGNPTPDTVGFDITGRSLAAGVALTVNSMYGTYDDWIRWRIIRP